MILPMMHPSVGHTYSKMTTLADTIVTIVLQSVFVIMDYLIETIDVDYKQ